MPSKILERALCPDCERAMTAAHVVHKRVPYSEDTAKCDWCHKTRYCTRYKVKIGKGEEHGEAETNQQSGNL